MNIMELIVTNEDNGYKVSVSLPNNSFNFEFLKRVFQVTFKFKNDIKACSNFSNTQDLSLFIDNYFNVAKFLL